MASLNKVFLIGNLTKDPELKFVPSGQAVANLRLAVNRKYKAANGEFKDEVTYIGVEVWGKDAERAGEYLKKGWPLLVEGRLKLREWTGTDGNKRSVLEVVCERWQFLPRGTKPEGVAAGGESFGGGASAPEASVSEASAPEAPASNDDDIPF